MKVSLIQFQTSATIQDNIDRLSTLAIEPADVLILPELWLTPFDNEKIVEARPYEQKARKALSALARTHHAYVVGGTICHEQAGRFYNTCFVYDRDGNEIAQGDKIHLLEVHARHDYFEQDVFAPGNKLVRFEIDGVPCGLVVCYDIRFPELTRLLALQGVRFLFVPAAFNDKVGHRHWDALLKARAIENEIFVIACAPDYAYRGFQSYGHSMIVDPFGQVVARCEKSRPVVCAELEESRIDAIRARMPLWKQRRADLYEVRLIDSAQNDQEKQCSVPYDTSVRS